jgi:hypothetical protein
MMLQRIWATSAIIDCIRVSAVPSLRQLLRKTNERAFCVTELLEIFEGIG